MQSDVIDATRHWIAGVVIGLNYMLISLMQRFSGNIIDASRDQITQLTKSAISLYFPFGSGFVTFEPVYAAIETPVTSLLASVNRAHDDLLEWSLEGGVASLVIMGLAGAWLVWINVQAWFRSGTMTATNACLRRACATAPILLLVHSSADYPLRTIAMMAVAAFCAGMCLEPFGAAPAQVSGETVQQRGRRSR